jgi:hypothetical protein
MLHRSIWLLAIVVCLGSCKKTNNDLPGTPPNDPGNTPVRLQEPGYGKSNEPFKDSPWALPAGVVLNTHWFDFCNSDTNWTKKKNYVGVPNPMLEFFVVCMEFQNTTGQMITITLPPIITLQSKYLETQNGFIISSLNVITIPPHQFRRMFASVYCINYTRHSPFDRVDLTNEWTLGPAKVPGALQEIVDIIAPKNLTYAMLINPDGRLDEVKAKKMWLVQEAIWEVTDSTGLTNETRQKLRDLTLQ